MPTTDVMTRIAEWLESLFTDPRAAAEFAESSANSLAHHDLTASDLNGVDLRSVAGGLGGPGISAEGQRVLTQFANSAPSHQPPVQQVAVVTREVHHDNPIVQRTFIDNSQTFNIDNSVNIDNTGGIINGDLSFDNDLVIASGKGAVAIGEDSDGNVVASGAGAVAAGDDVTQAGSGSFVAQNSDFDGPVASNSDGAVLAEEVAGANTGTIDGGVLAGGDTDDTVAGEGNVGISPDGGKGEGDRDQPAEQQQGTEPGAESEQSGEPAFGLGAPEGEQKDGAPEGPQPAEQPQDGVPDGQEPQPVDTTPDPVAAAQVDPDLPDATDQVVPKTHHVDDAPDGQDLVDDDQPLGV